MDGDDVAKTTMDPTPDRGRRWKRAARADELGGEDGEGPFALSVDGVDLVALRSGTSLKVFEGRCPHQGALLGEGEMERGMLVCRNHRWKFDPSSGKRQGGTACLRSCPAELRADGLWVDTGALPRPAEATKPTKTTRPRRTLADLPSPPGALPLIGHGLQLDVKRLHLVFEEWARAHGDVYAIQVPGHPYLCVSDPELCEAVLRARPETYRRDERVEPVFEELGVAGVFSAEGKAWRPQRRLAMEALAQKNLRTFYPTLLSVAERLRRRWERAAKSGAIVDIQDDLVRFTVDVTTSLVFGRDLGTLEGGDDVIQRHLELIFPMFAQRLNSIVPLWRFIRLPADRRVDRAVVAVRAWLTELVAEARSRMAADPARAERPANSATPCGTSNNSATPGGTSHNSATPCGTSHNSATPCGTDQNSATPCGKDHNFLESMLAARDDEGKPFTDEVIFGNAMTMLLAGEDTTANSLAWAVHLLCEEPFEVAALQKELDRELGYATMPPNLERANRLDRTNGVVQESMRLIPVAPVNFLQANHDTMLGDIEIPKGTGIVTLTRVPAIKEAHFTEPTRFRAARWIDAERTAGAHDPSVFQPFGSGPRICPGRSLALVEMRVVIAMLYKSFDVERVGKCAEVEERYAFTVMPEGLRVRLRAR